MDKVELKHPCVEKKKLGLTHDILSTNQARNELAAHFKEAIASPSNTKTGIVPPDHRRVNSYWLSVTRYLSMPILTA